MKDSLTSNDGSEMVLIPSGEFIFGVSDAHLQKLTEGGERTKDLRDEGEDLEQQHVILPHYYIDKFLVTNGRYRQFLKTAGRRKPRLINSSIWGSDEQPVV